METGLLSRLLGVARTVTALAPVSPVTLTLPQLELGQVVRAQVAARLADGSFHVVIEDTALKLTLPAGTKPGDVLPLRLLARQPRLQFELHVPSAEVNPEANPPLSSTGRLIGQLLSEPAGLAPRQAQPVVATPTTEPAQLHAPLARAVERSGLFYEAHQARWIRGDYPLERLREEPQTAMVKDRLGAGERLVGGDQTNALVARETIPIVRQQLDTLETRPVGWQGEVWPGQFMRWEIAEQEHDAKRPEHERDWLTQLSLSLPALGDISAQLEFGARGVRVALSAKDSATTQAMHAAAPELLHALEAAGVGRVTLKVRHDEFSR